jgi:ketosteroid isomerase-like protein
MDCPKCGCANLDRATKCLNCEGDLPTLPRPRGWLLRHPLLTAIAGALVASLLGGLFVLLKDSGGDVVLIRVDTTQANAFVPVNFDLQTPDPNVVPAMPDVPKIDDQQANGTLPGMYGRSGNGVACDVEKLVSYLVDPAHESQARAWAGVAGIDAADIRTYFARLTPVRLRFDTRVTNYDYKDGAANGFEAVLQAGTSVLVDDRGVPRAKCNCGNPLTEASGSDSSGDVADFASNPDDAWDRFDPGKVITVAAGDQTDELVLLDLDDGEAFRRGVGTTGAKDAPVRRDNPVCAILGQSTSCGGPGPQATPEDVAALEQAVRGLVAAVRNEDCDALVSYMSTGTLAQFGAGRQEVVSMCQDAFRQLESFGGLTIDDVRVVSQTGAQAVISVTATVNGQTSTEENQLIRENGNWKLNV